MTFLLFAKFSGIVRFAGFLDGIYHNQTVFGVFRLIGNTVIAIG
jgi:hypothetical protein